jgi:hypothetical protein
MRVGLAVVNPVALTVVESATPELHPKVFGITNRRTSYVKQEASLLK